MDQVMERPATPPTYQLNGKRVWVAGHGGMVGSALTRRLESEGCELITVDRHQLDLRDQQATRRWLTDNKPEAIFVSAATVGGILANDSRPAEFLYDNLAIAANIIHAAAEQRVQKLIFLGAACIYPRLAPQPISEDSLLQGPPEPTNEWYTVAKIAGVKLCQAFRKQHGCDFISAVPANLYGPDDHFDEVSSHVIPSLLTKADKAKKEGTPEFVVWGSGKPIREFMYVDDCADGLVFLMKNYSDASPINVGIGEEISTGDLAREVCEVVGYRGQLTFDRTRPDGTPRKALDSSRIHTLGWRARVRLREGLEQTYRWYLASSRG
jgi:GDP-L-fucose synthase